MSMVSAFMKGFDIGKPIGAAIHDTMDDMKKSRRSGVSRIGEAFRHFDSNYSAEKSRMANNKLSNSGNQLG